MSERAQAKSITRPAISQAVEALAKKGLLTRVQSTPDRRFVEVALTPAGNDLLESVFSQTRAWMKERMKPLSAEELESITRGMDALKKMLDEESR
jgi:DNA-binding MarR family transcriptional regulator